jgi:hypothetical protein
MISRKTCRQQLNIFTCVLLLPVRTTPVSTQRFHDASGLDFTWILPHFTTELNNPHTSVDASVSTDFHHFLSTLCFQSTWQCRESDDFEFHPGFSLRVTGFVAHRILDSSTFHWN